MIPTEKELIGFIKKKKFVNFSAIARSYKIHNATVSDLIDLLVYKKLVKVEKMGGSKVVVLK